jgi:hypothetical protein
MKRSRLRDACCLSAAVPPIFGKAGRNACVGRILRISPEGEWTLVAEYDGWPEAMRALVQRYLPADEESRPDPPC